MNFDGYDAKMISRLHLQHCEKHFQLTEPKFNSNMNVIYYLVLDIS